MKRGRKPGSKNTKSYYVKKGDRRKKEFKEKGLKAMWAARMRELGVE